MFIAYKDTDDRMVPVNDNGVIRLFESMSEARDAAGALGVGAWVRCKQLLEIAEWYELKGEANE